MILIFSIILILFIIRLLTRRTNSLNVSNSNRLKPQKEVVKELTAFTFTFLGAKEGIFDKSYFINEESKKFKFPNYNKGNKKYLVKIKDTTNYKENYFSGISKQEKENFSFNDFERNYFTPDLEIDSFEDFLDGLADSCFNFTVGKGQSIFLLSMFDEYLIENEIELQRFDKNMAHEIAGFGFLEISNKQISREDYLKDLTIQELIYLANKIILKPYKTKKALINQLLKVEFEVPIVYVIPTDQLVKYFLSFAEMYIIELKRNADRFYPLYIETILKEAELINDNQNIRTIIQRELKSNYWMDRLEHKRI